MHTRLGKELEVGDSPLPAITLKNRDRIRRSEFPILWIPRTKCLNNDVTAATVVTVAHLVLLRNRGHRLGY